MKIYKSNFTAEELDQWNALIAKGKVAPEDNQDEMEDEVPAFPPKKPAQKAEGVEDAKKSFSPELQAAMAEVAALKKSFAMKEMTEVAKKYAPLGKKEAELAQTLYDMKKSSEDNYNAYIAILDEGLELVNKSGLFSEVGKSAGGYSAASGAEAKAEAKAQEIMKSNPDMDYTTAIAKAWEDPAIMAEYDEEYSR